MDINALISLLTIIAFLLLGYTQYENYSNEVTSVKSSIDNNEYIVRNRDDKQEAADILAKIRTKLEKLVNSMKVKYPNDESVNRMNRKFNADNISESGQSSQYTSYSVNKGEKIVFCIRQKDEDQTFVDLNTIAFVAIHELAHVMSKSIGHTDEFWKNFKLLLQEAINIGIYDKENYSQSPKDYCGIKVTDSPLEN
jgi:predicted metal-dependent hydrolase|tara:strand:- start:7907 stop:8494 length:588 start_codon:yes stop_codon:yes gene_type:complete